MRGAAKGKSAVVGDFTTPDKARASVPELVMMLRERGYPMKLEFSNTDKDTANVMNCIAKLLRGIDQEKESASNLSAELKSCKGDLSSKEKEVEHRMAQMQVLSGQCGNLTIDNQKLHAQLKGETEKFRLQEREYEKRSLDSDRRIKQYQHEIRRKELEFEVLQDRLRRYLAERTRDQHFMQQAHTHILQLLGKEMGKGQRAPDEDMYKAAIKLYIEKLDKKEQEHLDMRDALSNLEREHKIIVNELARVKAHYGDESVRRVRQSGLSHEEIKMSKVEIITKMREMQKKYADLQASAEEARKVRRLAQKELDSAAQQHKKQLEATVAELDEDKLRDLHAATEAAEARMQESIQAVEAEAAAQVAKANQRSAELEEKLSELRSQMLQVQRDKRMVAGEVKARDTEVAALSGELEQAQAASRGLADNVATLKARLAAQEAAHRDLKTAFDQRNAALQQARMQLAEGWPEGTSGVRQSRRAAPANAQSNASAPSDPEPSPGYATAGAATAGSRDARAASAGGRALVGSDWFVGASGDADDIVTSDQVAAAGEQYASELQGLARGLPDRLAAVLEGGYPAVMHANLAKIAATQAMADHFERTALALQRAKGAASGEPAGSPAGDPSSALESGALPAELSSSDPTAAAHEAELLHGSSERSGIAGDNGMSGTVGAAGAPAARVLELEDTIAGAHALLTARDQALKLSLIALHDAHAQHEAALRSFEDEKRSDEGALAGAERNAAELAAQVAALQAAKAAVESVVERLQAERQAQDSATATEAQEAQQRVEGLEKELVAAEEQILSLNLRVSEQEEQSLELEAQMQEAKAQAEAAATDNSRLEARIQELEEELEDARKLCSELEVEVQEMHRLADEQEAMVNELHDNYNKEHERLRRLEDIMAEQDEATRQALMKNAGLLDDQRARLLEVSEMKRHKLLEAAKGLAADADRVARQDDELRATQKAFTDAIEKWAPGFGAGKLLGKKVIEEAMAKRAEMLKNMEDARHAQARQWLDEQLHELKTKPPSSKGETNESKNRASKQGNQWPRMMQQSESVKYNAERIRQELSDSSVYQELQEATGFSDVVRATVQQRTTNSGDPAKDHSRTDSSPGDLQAQFSLLKDRTRQMFQRVRSVSSRRQGDATRSIRASSSMKVSSPGMLLPAMPTVDEVDDESLNASLARTLGKYASDSHRTLRNVQYD